jgi:hypothetical protein
MDLPLATEISQDRIFSGRRFSPADLECMRTIIAGNTQASRAHLSRLVCQALDWRKPDGGLKAMRCRVVMLRMQEQGLITLPPAQDKAWRKPGDATLRFLDPDTEPQPPVTQPVHDLLPLQITLITAADKAASRRCNTFIFRYHYLGYQRTAGAQLRYRVVAANGTELAYLAWGSAAWKTTPRDQWIGWTAPQRQERLHLVINNTRFLILPWVRSPNLASHVLGLICRRIPKDWNTSFGYVPVLAETFVDATRYTGHCYRAANWSLLGQTTGRSKWDRYKKLEVPKKDVWVYPLAKNVTSKLCDSSSV